MTVSNQQRRNDNVRACAPDRRAPKASGQGQTTQRDPITTPRTGMKRRLRKIRRAGPRIFRSLFSSMTGQALRARGPQPSPLLVVMVVALSVRLAHARRQLSPNGARTCAQATHVLFTPDYHVCDRAAGGECRRPPASVYIESRKYVKRTCAARRSEGRHCARRTSLSGRRLERPCITAPLPRVSIHSCRKPLHFDAKIEWTLAIMGFLVLTDRAAGETG